MLSTIIMEDLLTTRELADFLRLNEKKVYQLVRNGNIPHVKIAGKWLFPREHILRWIDENVQREKDLQIVGSDDMLMTQLLSLYSREHYPESLAYYSSVGSMKGIRALMQKKGQACCAHLLDLETGEYNIPILNRVLSGERYVVVNLWYRQQGIVVKRGNPLTIKGFDDIIAKKARYINRNEGTGTRTLFDYCVRQQDLNVKDLIGVDDAVNSHLEVALRVFLDDADAGLAIEYVTQLLPLDFIPVREERFDLIVPRALWPTSLMKNFIAYIEPAKISTLTRSLPGYDLRDTGKIVFEN